MEWFRAVWSRHPAFSLTGGRTQTVRRDVGDLTRTSARSAGGRPRRYCMKTAGGLVSVMLQSPGTATNVAQPVSSLHLLLCAWQGLPKAS